MGKPSRDKGARFERTVADALQGQRVPLSGAVVGFPGDVTFDMNGERWRAECKKRATGFKFDYQHLADNDILVKAADRMPPLVTMRFEKFVAMKAELERLTADANREE